MSRARLIFFVLLPIGRLICFHKHEFPERQLFEIQDPNQEIYFELESGMTVLCEKKSLETQSSVWENGAPCVIFVKNLLCVIEGYKLIRHYILHRKWLKQLSYQQFMMTFSFLLPLEQQIKHIQHLLYLSAHGTFPEKIQARIYLVRLSLVHPYDKIVNDCAQKYYQANFDNNGHFVWHQNDDAQKHYKNFYKKVPQDFKALACCSEKISQNIKNSYMSEVFIKTENPHNQYLLDMIHAGISQNFPLLKKICRKYYDHLFERLYQYYIDQKHNNSLLQHGCYESEELLLQECYEQEMLSWLSPGKDQDFMLKKIIHEIILSVQVTELPMDPNYRFLLLRLFMDRIYSCDEKERYLFQEFFLSSGILKKYGYHVCHALNRVQCQDLILLRAINFALAICDKEQDEITHMIGKRLIEYVFCAIQAEKTDQFLWYKNKIVVLYEALSYKRYDQNILDI